MCQRPCSFLSQKPNDFVLKQQKKEASKQTSGKKKIVYTIRRGDNLGRIAPALKLVTNLVQAGSAVVGFPVKLEKVFQCLENINIGDLGAMYDNFKIEEDAVKNANIYKSDANSVQKELSTLVDDEISRKHLLNSREHLKNAVEQICPSWQKQLISQRL